MTDYESVKRYLSRAGRIRARIATLEASIYELEQMAYGVGAIRYDKDTVQVTPRDQTSEIIAEIEEKNRQMTDLIRKYSAALSEIAETINILSDKRYIRILSLHYLEELTLEAVSERIGQSPEHVRRLHSQAINELRKYIAY